MDHDTRTGYEIIVETLRHWGVQYISGVTGGGIIHFLSHIDDLSSELPETMETTGFFNIGEYAAGFMPLGSFLANGSINACIATTGAATKILSCGISDAKLHDIPALYIIPVSARSSQGLCPLQDTSASGSNAVEAIRAEIPNNVFVFDDSRRMDANLHAAAESLAHNKPTVLVLEHEALSRPTDIQEIPDIPALQYDEAEASRFCQDLARESRDRKIVILAGEELSRYPEAPSLLERLSSLLSAPVVWSINGANAVDHASPWGFGYISFGGNDIAMDTWNGIDDQTLLLSLGAAPDEYTINLGDFKAGATFCATALPFGYGQHGATLKRRSRGAFYQTLVPLDTLLNALIIQFTHQEHRHLPSPAAPQQLNTRRIAPPRPGHADAVQFFSMLHDSWPENTIGFDDVCLAYKDRPYITQRPSPNARFFSLYRGSAMGNTLGLACGAKLACPAHHVVAFTGDGCFRLFSGYMPEARNLGIVIFLLDNSGYGIVEQGVPVILPGVKASRQHTRLEGMDYLGVARSAGWKTHDLPPDLDGLQDILQQHWASEDTSLLIRVPIDAEQIAGINPRAQNL